MQWRPQVGHAVRHMSGAAKESGGSATPLIGLGLALAAGGAGVYFLGAPPPDATEDIMNDPKGYFTRAQAKASQLAKEQTADHKKNQTLFAAHAASAVPTQ